MNILRKLKYATLILFAWVVYLFTTVSKTKSVVKHKLITRAKYKKKWPFIVDKITLCAIKGGMVYASIDENNHIALNGFAQDKLKLPDPFKSGYVLRDPDNEKAYMDISYFINIGLKMINFKL